MVALWLFTTLKSYFAMRFRLKRERYLELASFTEMNFESTLATISFKIFVGYRSMKHWKHSRSTALAPFLRLLDALEQTLS